MTGRNPTENGSISDLPSEEDERRAFFLVVGRKKWSSFVDARTVRLENFSVINSPFSDRFSLTVIHVELIETVSFTKLLLICSFWKAIDRAGPSLLALTGDTK